MRSDSSVATKNPMMFARIARMTTMKKKLATKFPNQLKAPILLKRKLQLHLLAPQKMLTLSETTSHSWCPTTNLELKRPNQVAVATTASQLWLKMMISWEI